MAIYQQLEIFERAARPSLVKDRNGYLEECARGREVLHVGCTDSPITAERLRGGTLLHTQLQRSAKSLLGIDISDEGLDLLRHAGIQDVQRMDAEELPFKDEFDVVIAGDVLEHLSNPGRFLLGAARSLRPGGELVVAVPCAFTANTIKAWLFGREQVHKDHCFYFSPKTLSSLCSRYGLGPVHLAFTMQSKQEGEGPFFVWLREAVTSACLTMAPAIIMRFKKDEDIDRSNSYTWG